MLIVSQDLHRHPTLVETDSAAIHSNSFSVNKPHLTKWQQQTGRDTECERGEKINMRGWMEDGDVSGNWRREKSQEERKCLKGPCHWTMMSSLSNFRGFFFQRTVPDISNNAECVQKWRANSQRCARIFLSVQTILINQFSIGKHHL